MKSDLGLMPNSDGKVIRLNIPPLTEERRRELTKQVNKRVEEAKVAIRNVRRDIQHDIRDMENEKMVSEDEAKRGQDDLQKLTDKYVKLVEEAGATKDAEIMAV
jgi:ribosome recycling factor